MTANQSRRRPVRLGGIPSNRDEALVGTASERYQALAARGRAEEERDTNPVPHREAVFT